MKNKNRFSANLEVTCHEYYLKNDALRKAIGRAKRKRNSIDRSCVENRKKVRRMIFKIVKLNKKRSDLLDKIETMKTDGSINLIKNKKLGFLESEINVRGILAVFHISAAGYDVDKLMSMMGIEGANSFERNFSRHSPKTSAVIRDICENIMRQAMYNEIIATLEEKGD